MITFKELSRRLPESVGAPEDIFYLLEEWFYLFEDSTFYIYRTDTTLSWQLVSKVLRLPSVE